MARRMRFVYREAGIVRGGGPLNGASARFLRMSGDAGRLVIELSERMGEAWPAGAQLTVGPGEWIRHGEATAEEIQAIDARRVGREDADANA